MPTPEPPTQRELFEWKHIITKQSKPFFNGLPLKLRDALRVYKYTGYASINKFLRVQKNNNEKNINPFGYFMLDKTVNEMQSDRFDNFLKLRANIN